LAVQKFMQIAPGAKFFFLSMFIYFAFFSNGVFSSAFCTMQQDLKYGCSDYHDRYDYVCCDNSHYAEHAGFLNKVNLWSQIDSEGVTTYYDSVCNVPLFRAPIGRSFEEFQEESNHHGWPSFRTEEILWDNIVVKDGGEVLSKQCKTHLGHNLPDSKGDRFCINLMCIAGHKSDTDSGEAALSMSDPSTSSSQKHTSINGSASENSNDGLPGYAIFLIVLCAIALLSGVFYFYKQRNTKLTSHAILREGN